MQGRKDPPTFARTMDEAGGLLGQRATNNKRQPRQELPLL